VREFAESRADALLLFHRSPERLITFKSKFKGEVCLMKPDEIFVLALVVVCVMVVVAMRLHSGRKHD